MDTPGVHLAQARELRLVELMEFHQTDRGMRNLSYGYQAPHAVLLTYLTETRVRPSFAERCIFAGAQTYFGINIHEVESIVFNHPYWINVLKTCRLRNDLWLSIDVWLRVNMVMTLLPSAAQKIVHLCVILVYVREWHGTGQVRLHGIKGL